MNRRCEYRRFAMSGGLQTGKPTSIRRSVAIVLIPCLLSGFLWLTTAFASGGEGAGEHAGLNWFDFFWRFVNFLVLIALLYWLLAKKTKDFFSGRRDGIRTSLAEAEAAREAAQKKFQEYSAKLDKATEEIDQISRMITAQGVAEKERLIEEGRKAAEKMKEDARTRMEQEFNKASQQLRTEAVRLSTQMAEDLLSKHLQPSDHEAMVKDTIEKMARKQ